MWWSYYPQLCCREHSPSCGSVSQTFQHFNSLRKEEKKVSETPLCDHVTGNSSSPTVPWREYKVVFAVHGFPGNFIQDGDSSLLLHVCESVSGLKCPLLASPLNESTSPYNHTLTLALAWHQLSSALEGLDIGGSMRRWCPWVADGT